MSELYSKESRKSDLLDEQNECELNLSKGSASDKSKDSRSDNKLSDLSTESVLSSLSTESFLSSLSTGSVLSSLSTESILSSLSTGSVLSSLSTGSVLSSLYNKIINNDFVVNIFYNEKDDKTYDLFDNQETLLNLCKLLNLTPLIVRQYRSIQWLNKYKLNNIHVNEIMKNNYEFSKNMLIIFDMYTHCDYKFNELIESVKKNGNKILINFLPIGAYNTTGIHDDVSFPITRE